MTDLEQLQADFEAMKVQQAKDSVRLDQAENELKVLRHKIDDLDGGVFDALNIPGVSVAPNHDDILVGYKGKTYWRLVEPEFWDDMPMETEH